MQQDPIRKKSLADRSKFIILQTDFCLAGVCAAVRQSNSGMRSLTVLKLAEDILSDAYTAQPLCIKDILSLKTQGGICVTTYLAKTSKRFPLLLKELEGCEGLKARSDHLKSIIEKPHLTVFTQQLEPRAIAHQPKTAVSPSVITPAPTVEDTKNSDHTETKHSFIVDKPVLPSKPFSATRELAKGLLGIAG